ncbi:MAG: NAD-dependent epimerase/dehydratase family protein [Alphaproteobacteria bacterium]|nr:NAD-dependent epimerase/dehydratase family protein [Alphaproteobacteria bacterium]
MANILVTGAGGYIGSVLTPLLLSEGHTVRALDRFFFGAEMLADHPQLQRVREDARRIAPAHLEGCDAVIDLVALSNDPAGEEFRAETYAINHQSRAATARLAKAAGVQRYILPSSCSIYGFQDPDVRVDEAAPTNPLTTYARANERAEQDVLPLADKDFTVVVLRQATAYGLSPRVRFDLAINGMTFGAWKTGVLPLMRDGTQWRPMAHVRDLASAQLYMLTAPQDRVNGEIFNVGSDANNYQLGPLADIVAAATPRDVRIEWYGDPDHRSYRVNFDKIERLGWTAKLGAEDGVRELCAALEDGRIDKTTQTLTLDWYRELMRWHERIKQVELYGGILRI